MSTGPDPHWASLLVCTTESVSALPLPISEEITAVFVLKINSACLNVAEIATSLSAFEVRDCKLVLLVSSADPPWDRLSALVGKPGLELYWTTAVWASSVRVYVMKGKETMYRLNSVPKDIKPYLRRPVCTLGQLAKKIAAGDTEDLIAAYCEVNAKEEMMGEPAIGEVLALLGRRLGVDLRPAEEWFSTHKNPSGAEDIIHPRDITFKQFIGRLRSYCEHCNPTHSLSASLDHDHHYQASLWQSRIKALESQVQSLRSELASKNNTIMRLQQDLQRRPAGRGKHSSLPTSPERIEEGSTTGQSAASIFIMHRPHAQKQVKKNHAKPPMRNKHFNTLHEGL